MLSRRSVVAKFIQVVMFYLGMGDLCSQDLACNFLPLFIPFYPALFRVLEKACT